MHRCLRALITAIGTLAVGTAGAAATDIHVGLSVASGELTVRTISTTQHALRLQVTDARGTGQGWTLLLTSTNGTVVITNLHAACAAHSTCTLPSPHRPLPITLTQQQPTPILHAANLTGMGSFTIDVTTPNDHPEITASLTTHS